MNNEQLKQIVQEKYSIIANQDKSTNESSCCGGTSCCDSIDYTIFSDDYSGQEGYEAEADLGLGCGIPTTFAGIKKGQHVLDLGSGAGNDCFVARALVGEEGYVCGIDFTEAMLVKAKQNAQKLAYSNVEFVKGDIENMPLESNSFDVVISNCVLNLVPNKSKAFQEIYRVLKPGGHFCVSDVVLSGKIPEKLKQEAELYAGCVSGAIDKDEYLKKVLNAGFTEYSIHKEKAVEIPNSIMLNYMSMEELRAFKRSKTGIYSITVSAKK